MWVSGLPPIMLDKLDSINRIEDLSLVDSMLLQSTVVSIGYGSDVEQVMAFLTRAAVA